MSNVINFLTHKRSGSPFKVANCKRGNRFLYFGVKCATLSGDTVEVAIISDKPQKKRRYLSRVTIHVDELRELIRQIDREQPFTAQKSPTSNLRLSRESGVAVRLTPP
jgi:hypothetical protein